MTRTIHLGDRELQGLDLSPLERVVREMLDGSDPLAEEQLIQFQIEYTREPEDPRELSEIPEVRLWFIRANAAFPWLPVLLDWKAGELARYTAMLVPHEFHRQEGIKYNPEALEIFLMGKIFAIRDWLRQRGVSGTSRLLAMAQLLGYELDEGLFQFLDASSGSSSA